MEAVFFGDLEPSCKHCSHKRGAVRLRSRPLWDARRNQAILQPTRRQSSGTTAAAVGNSCASLAGAGEVSGCAIVSGWKRRHHVGNAPPERALNSARITPLERTLRKFPARPNGEVILPEVGASFDSIGEVYDFYNLYSWERGFGVRYGKSRLNVNRVKCMQEIVCGCSGKLRATNSHSTRCLCPALICLLRSKDKGWYICEHRENHSHELSASFGERTHWPFHRHIDSYTKDLCREMEVAIGNVLTALSIDGANGTC
ncbi:uncharacterized protein [Lolium perenne]|uniref:uncharacterized protein n=1 Tax=Lolium perenne TaxID=4522 RepID=UPI0021F5CA85|nr:uncharacterized protein LOC127338737 [Lolium perenne]